MSQHLETQSPSEPDEKQSPDLESCHVNFRAVKRDCKSCLSCLWDPVAKSLLRILFVILCGLLFIILIVAPVIGLAMLISGDFSDVGDSVAVAVFLLCLTPALLLLLLLFCGCKHAVQHWILFDETEQTAMGDQELNSTDYEALEEEQGVPAVCRRPRVDWMTYPDLCV